MLLGQVADNRAQLLPYQRFGDESLRIEPGTRITFTRCREFRTGHDQVMIAPGNGHRRQLEEVSGKHHLQSAKRPRILANDTAHLIDHVEQPRMQHGNLVDDEDVGRLQLALASRANGGDEFIGQRVGKTYATP